MKPFGLAIISLALVVVASASPLLNSNSKTTVVDIPVFADYKTGNKCPAPVFSDGCNTCICLKDGVTAGCTLKYCSNYDEQKRAVRSTKIPVFPNYKAGDKCPAPVFNDGCNNCVCAANGSIAACTKMACVNIGGQKRAVHSEVPVFPNYKAGDKCPAKHFNDGCNDCVCSDDGVTAACTLKQCLNFDGQERAVRSDKIPVFPTYKFGDKCPAKIFSDGCNSCVCNADGVTAACTIRLCPENRQTRAENLPVVYGYLQGDKCPAQQFYDDCNRCFCLPDGHSAGCTKMACSPRRETRSVDDVPVISGYKHGDKCPAKHFFDKCNRCFCLPDGHSAGCTKMACPA